MSSPESFQQLNNLEVPTRVDVRYIELPREAIKEVRVNPLAMKLLPAEYQYLLQPENLLKNAVISVPMNFEGGLVANVAYSAGRDVETANNLKIPVLGMLFTRIACKGGFLSGGNYIPENIIEDSHIKSLGFFGLSDAKRSEERSNKLIEEGFRTFLSLGVIVLDIDKVFEIIEASGWTSETIDRAKKNLNYFKESNEELVLQIRCMGHSERLETQVLTAKKQPSRIQLNEALQKAFRESMGQFNDELISFPELYSSFLDKGHDKLGALSKTLLMLNEGKVPGSLDLLSQMYSGLIIKNMKALYSLYLKAKLEETEVPILTISRDLDATMFINDLEFVPKFFQSQGRRVTYTLSAYLEAIDNYYVSNFLVNCFSRAGMSKKKIHRFSQQTHERCTDYIIKVRDAEWERQMKNEF